METKLPEEVIAVCHKYGISGKTIYIPKISTHKKEKRKKILIALLEEMETFYENHLETFQRVPHPFTVRQVRARYSISTWLASTTLRAALRTWRHWFNNYEKMIFSGLSPRTKPEYLQIRTQLRNGLKPSGREDLIQKARESIQTCPWRN